MMTNKSKAITDADLVNFIEHEIDNADQIIARKWGESGQSIEVGDLKWLIELARKALKAK